MAVLASANLPAVQAQHARVDRLIRAGLVDLTPVIKDCTRDMYATAKDRIADENQGRNPARRPNTLLRGTPALGGASGRIAQGTRIVGLQSRATPRQYDILCFSTPIGEMMQTGTRRHRITAHNPSGRLAFPVVANGGGTPLASSGHFARGYRTVVERGANGYERTRRIRVTETAAVAHKRRTVASRLLGAVAVSWRTPQSVNHPGTPPRPFLVYPDGYFDAHLWQRAVSYISLAASGTLGEVL